MRRRLDRNERRRVRRSWWAPLAMALLSLALPASAAPKNPTALHVFAAASLAESFGEIAKSFERAHPGVTVRLNLAGSQQLAAQLEQGAPGDVLATADERWMSYVQEKGLVSGDPRPFASNKLVVIVPKSNPARISRLQDLSRTGVKVVLGASSVPVGTYAREMLANLSRQDGFSPDYSRKVLSNVVSNEESVRGVVGKVQLGEADAGVSYRSDVSPRVARYVTVMAIPDSANVTARYPIATLSSGKQAELSRAFVDLVLSDEGQRTLGRYGFGPPQAAP